MCPVIRNDDCTTTAASDNVAPVITIVSAATRPVNRVEMKLPDRKPSGNSTKKKPNSTDGRLSSSFMNVDDAVATVRKVPVLKPVCRTNAEKRM